MVEQGAVGGSIGSRRIERRYRCDRAKQDGTWSGESGDRILDNGFAAEGRVEVIVHAWSDRDRLDPDPWHQSPDH